MVEHKKKRILEKKEGPLKWQQKHYEYATNISWSRSCIITHHHGFVAFSYGGLQIIWGNCCFFGGPFVHILADVTSVGSCMNEFPFYSIYASRYLYVCCDLHDALPPQTKW
jgi:hypothetical protein